MNIFEGIAFMDWTNTVRVQLEFNHPKGPTYNSFDPSLIDADKTYDNIMVIHGPPSRDLNESDKSDNTSSANDNDLPLINDNGDDVSSVQGNDDGTSSASTHEDEHTSDNHIATIHPINGRPNFSLDLIKDSKVTSMLPNFLAQMHAANQELEEDRAAGTLANRRIELDEGESAIEGEQYIEMNLGLGVLEEKGDVTGTTSASDSGGEEGDVEIMEKLLGGKRKRGMEDEDEEAPKKAKIQEV